MAGSLFERLAMGQRGMDMDEDESIRAHILRMFTARQGSVQALPDYGLPDINDLNLSRTELANVTAQVVQDCINRYEPRLSSVSVSPIKLPHAHFTLAFKITAMKNDEDGTQRPWEWTVTLEGEKMKGPAV